MRKRLIAAALAIAFTLGCEEKSASKSSSSSANEGLSSSATVSASPEEQAKIAARMAEIEKAAEAVEKAKVLTSCGKGGGNVKLLECITNDSGDLVSKYEYDDKNRLVKIYNYADKKISTKTITYNSDNLVTVEEAGSYEIVTKYVKKGNTITSESYTWTINEDGYIVKDSDNRTYQYENGNLTKISDESKDSDEKRDFQYVSFEYDDKKSPFFNSNTPKWLFILMGIYEAKNNIINNVKGFVVYDEPGALDGWGDSSSEEFEYKYDSEGFAIKQTMRGFYVGAEDEDPVTKVYHFIYSGKEGAK